MYTVARAGPGDRIGRVRGRARARDRRFAGSFGRRARAADGSLITPRPGGAGTLQGWL
eukprot:SAG22_NODE_3783_length_1532_cov_0.810188_3_plen_57_part_01